VKSNIKELLITLGLAAVIYLLLQTAIQSSIVNNVSMQPTLIDGQRLIVVKAWYLFSDPDRGDIIVIRPPIAPDEEWVKRVIGLPGDTIEVFDNRVYVNGVALYEPYLKEQPHYTFSSFTVPEDNYFVLGDNRNNSTDSHYGWTVPREEIIGKAWLRFWPFDKWGTVGSFPLTRQINSAVTAGLLPSGN
jgi:signal peptidase I